MVQMQRHATPTDREEDDDAFNETERPALRERLRDWIMHNPRDAVALLVAVTATVAIAVNALFLQPGPHPAPLFALRPFTAAQDAMAMPRARPAADGAVQISFRAPRTRADLVADIQRGLATRGFYDGAVDGIYGPRTDAAVRDFAQAAHTKLGNEPTQAMLDSIANSAVKETRPAPPASMSPPRHDPIADLIGPSSRILAVQRVLSDFGYGQIKPTGVPGPETAAAIEKFERSRSLPVTGQVSNTLVRELAAVSGRPLE